MGRVTIIALRVIIALSLLGSIAVQALILPLLWTDLTNVPLPTRIVAVTVLGLGVLTMQVFAVCVWQLLTLVRRGAVFSDAAFRYVDVIIGAVAAAAVLVFAFAVLLALGEAAPGVVGIVCGLSLSLAGVTLLVVVMRMLLRQAIEREREARHLRDELSEVI